MTAEAAGGSKLAEFVSNHVLGHIDGNEFVAIMHGEGVAHEFGGNHGSAAPGLDYGFLSACFHRIDLLFELDTDVGSFF